MKNGKDYCQFIRQEINDLLTKAHLPVNERATFDRLDFGWTFSPVIFPFSFSLSETLSSDLLDAYDAEYDRLFQFYQKRKPVLDAYEKWHSFWKDYLVFTVS